MHCSRRRLLRRRLEFHVWTINKSAHTKKVWKLISWSSYVFFSVCMHKHTYIYKRTYIHIHTHIHMYTYIYTHIHMHAYTCTHIFTHVYTHTYIYIYINTYIHACILTHLFIYIHTYVRTCLHTYARIYTYIYYTHSLLECLSISEEDGSINRLIYFVRNYLVPYIKCTYFLNKFFISSIFKWVYACFFFLHTVKWLQVIPYNTNNSI